MCLCPLERPAGQLSGVNGRALSLEEVFVWLVIGDAEDFQQHDNVRGIGVRRLWQSTQLGVELRIGLNLVEWPLEVVNVTDHESFFQQTGGKWGEHFRVMQRECQSLVNSRRFD